MENELYFMDKSKDYKTLETPIGDVLYDDSDMERCEFFDKDTGVLLSVGNLIRVGKPENFAAYFDRNKSKIEAYRSNPSINNRRKIVPNHGLL